MGDTSASYDLGAIATSSDAASDAASKATVALSNASDAQSAATAYLDQSVKEASGPSFAHLHLADVAAITTAAESWVGPSSTTGVYFKGGNVGIGTTSPYGKLHIVEGAGYGVSFRLQSAIGGLATTVGIHAINDVSDTWRDLAIEAETILLNYGTGGKVGINDPAPAEKLDVNGNINVTGVYKIADAQVLNQDVSTTAGPTFDHLHLTTDLPVSEGGTGKSSFTLYAIPYASGTTTIGEIAIGGAGKVLAVAAGATGYEWIAAGGTAYPDPYLCLLLHFNGADDAIVFPDSSKNSVLMTRVGDAHIHQGEKKLGNASLYLDGSDYLTFPSSAWFAFGTGDFTIDFWINAGSMNDKVLISGRQAIGTMIITTGGSGGSTVGVLRYVGSSTIVSTTVITDGTWHHCAIVRCAGAIALYVDGTSEATGTDTTNYTTVTGTWYIGENEVYGSGYLTGYLDEIRISNMARWTSGFTSPAVEYAASISWGG